jgi:hypothetical protein
MVNAEQHEWILLRVISHVVKSYFGLDGYQASMSGSY